MIKTISVLHAAMRARKRSRIKTQPRDARASTPAQVHGKKPKTVAPPTPAQEEAQ